MPTISPTFSFRPTTPQTRPSSPISQARSESDLDPFRDWDVFEEALAAASRELHTPSTPVEAPLLYASFDRIEALQFCTDSRCLSAMDEIAECNRNLFRKNAYTYAFYPADDPQSFSLSLNETLASLFRGEEIRTSRGKNPYHDRPELKTIHSLQEFRDWWEDEKRFALL